LVFHDYRSLPVAKTVSIAQVGDSLIATAEFITADVSPFADQCFRMAAGGFMSGCSVGFRPSPGFQPKSNQFGGFDFPKAELLGGVQYRSLPTARLCGAECAQLSRRTA
jgi:hypothetical protein